MNITIPGADALTLGAFGAGIRAMQPEMYGRTPLGLAVARWQELTKLPPGLLGSPRNSTKTVSMTMLNSLVNTVSLLGLAAVPVPPAIVYALIASSFSKYSPIAFAELIVRFYVYAPVFLFWIIVLAMFRVPLVIRSIAAGCLMFLPKWVLYGPGSHFGMMLDLLSGVLSGILFWTCFVAERKVWQSSLPWTRD